jgi:hypothetical protein
MSSSKTNSTRRAFFLQGGAALGAGVASATGAAAKMPDKKSPDSEVENLQERLASMTECEAIRQVQLAFAAMIETQAYEAAADLFTADARLHLSGAAASGRPAIEQLFADQYRHQKAEVMHSAYRHRDLSKDAVVLDDTRQVATATFYLDVVLTTPLPGDSTIAKMARLQGQTASRSWEPGRLEAGYVKTQGQWKIASLTWLAA